MALAVDQHRTPAYSATRMLLYSDEQADLGVILPNSNTIGDFDPEIAWRFKYADAGPVNFDADDSVRNRGV
jgi:hypothetical protein